MEEAISHTYGERTDDEPEEEFLHLDTMHSFCDKSIQNVPIMCDVSTSNVPKLKSTRTQYNVSHFESEQIEPIQRSSKPLFVKIPPKKKQKDAEVNTIVTFKPNDYVVMTIKNEVFATDTETEIEELTEESDSDSMYDPKGESDIEKEAKVSSSEISGDTKFLVFWSSLLPLLKYCLNCRAKAAIESFFIKGTMLIVNLFCENSHKTVWYSQPNVRGMAEGNLVVATSVLFSGNTFQSIKEMMEIGKICFISHTTFNSIQKNILFPAIHRVFTTNRQILFDEAHEQDQLHLLGDGRCDSPGYNAKYGTYTIMNSLSGFILDFHISHVKIAGNSQRMELDGLKHVLQRMSESTISITSLTTDRHKQVRKFMRKEKKEINHQFDVWHMGKNIKKKLSKLAKQKRNMDLNPWIKSIINHFWWACASCNGNATELKEKWTSILYHITDRHQWKGCHYFKKCAHKKLSQTERSCKPFLKLNSPSFLSLEKVVTDKSLVADLAYLTNFSHTGTLEVYHSLYNKYCPKRLHFSYQGMIARSQLAVLDFNSGVGLAQAQTRQGDKKYKLQFSKVTQNWVVKKVSSQKEKVYLDHLLAEVNFIQSSNTRYSLPKLDGVPKNIAPSQKPNKKEAIQNIRTRFVV